jgi:hypothetical protein
MQAAIVTGTAPRDAKAPLDAAPVRGTAEHFTTPDFPQWLLALKANYDPAPCDVSHIQRLSFHFTA